MHIVYSYALHLFPNLSLSQQPNFENHNWKDVVLYMFYGTCKTSYHSLWMKPIPAEKATLNVS